MNALGLCSVFDSLSSVTHQPVSRLLLFVAQPSCPPGQEHTAPHNSAVVWPGTAQLPANGFLHFQIAEKIKKKTKDNY